MKTRTAEVTFFVMVVVTAIFGLFDHPVAIGQCKDDNQKVHFMEIASTGGVFGDCVGRIIGPEKVCPDDTAKYIVAGEMQNKCNSMKWEINGPGCASFNTFTGFFVVDQSMKTKSLEAEVGIWQECAGKSYDVVASTKNCCGCECGDAKLSVNIRSSRAGPCSDVEPEKRKGCFAKRLIKAIVKATQGDKSIARDLVENQLSEAYKRREREALKDAVTNKADGKKISNDDIVRVTEGLRNTQAKEETAEQFGEIAASIITTFSKGGQIASGGSTLQGVVTAQNFIEPCSDQEFINDIRNAIKERKEG